MIAVIFYLYSLDVTSFTEAELCERARPGGYSLSPAEGDKLAGVLSAWSSKPKARMISA